MLQSILLVVRNNSKIPREVTEAHLDATAPVFGARAQLPDVLDKPFRVGEKVRQPVLFVTLYASVGVDDSSQALTEGLVADFPVDAAHIAIVVRSAAIVDVF